MKTERIAPTILCSLILVLAALCLWQEPSGVCADGEPLPVKMVTSQQLGGATRALTYLSTDKPVYRAGEKVYLRAVVLDSGTNIPVRNGGQGRLLIKGPKGDIVFRATTQVQESVAGSAWTIPSGMPGGRYRAVASCQGSAQAERVFEIRAYTPPRLKSQIEFARKGYGPSDTVTASIHVERAEGGIPAAADVTAIARVDGVEVYRKAGLVIDDEGNCSAAFPLPDEIAVGDGTLSFLIEDGGVKETASKTIPILLQTMEISFYPESGELIDGKLCRVYVQALRPDGKPADIAGSINGGTSVVTSHEGRGVFEFVPKAGTDYALRLSKPAGIEKAFPLPAVKKEGALLKTLQRVYPFEGKIALAFCATAGSGAAKVTLSKRETELDAQAVTAGVDATLTLNPKDAEGVLMATVWAKDGTPLAERLLFRAPRFGLKIQVTPESDAFVPGGKVKLHVETTDTNGTPVEAVVGLTVTDDAVLEMIEKREQAPRLPVMVYLENEVRDLGDAHVYLDRSNPQAPEAVDLLLGTQGWRRFVLVRYSEIIKTDPKAAKRALAWSTVCRPVPPGAVFFERRLQKGANREMEDAKAEGLVEVGVAPPAAKPQAALPGEVPAKEVKEPLPVDAQAGKKAKRADKMVRPRLPVMVEEAEMDILLEVAEDRMDLNAGPYIMIREYAHKVRPNRRPNDRVDFTETLYWNAGIRTNPRTGKATVEFGLSDSVTTFRVLADAFGNNGALGAASSAVESVEPFYIEPKMPQEVIAGDVIDLPVALINSTGSAFDSANLIVTAKGLQVSQSQAAPLGAGERARRLVKVRVPSAGTYSLRFSAAADNFTDTVTRPLVVKPRGFPMAVNAGGLVGPEKQFAYSLVIPEAVEPGSLNASVKVFPTPLANMEQALTALMREPCGCFEQTSSSNYPLVMAQQYFTTHQGIAPQKIKKARELLEKGYKRLVGYECKKKGYEWFGSGPGHEALTAYGLMEFADMAKVMELDKAMVQRTRDWLLSRKDGKGGFKRNSKALDSFGRAPAPTTNAYIVWSLIEAGQDPASMKAEIEALKKSAQSSKDSYVIALAANVLYKTGDSAAARALAKKLVGAVEKDGSVGSATTSVTRSGGQALTIETTALAILAWLQDPDAYSAAVERSMKWLFERCKGGRFGSTQSTILALKAINAYDQARAKPEKPGKVQLMVDGKAFGNPVPFDKDSKGAIELPDFSAALQSGKHEIELVMEGGVKMPFALDVQYNTNLPASGEGCLLKLETKLSALEIEEGEPMEMAVKVQVGDKDAPTPIAIIGLPAGLAPRHDQLKELVDAGRISAYEVIGNEVVLYWRALRANATASVPLSLTARLPGNYTAPASRAYLYYTDEAKVWAGGANVLVLAK